jgi:cytochrome P450
MKYLDLALKEILRLYPFVPVNSMPLSKRRLFLLEVAKMDSLRFLSDEVN